MNQNSEKSPYATLSAKPIKAPNPKKGGEPKSSKIVGNGDLRAGKGK